MKNIKDYDLEDLKKELVSIGEKPFRAEQIFKWLYQEKVKDFDEMTNLSLDLRKKLKENYTICNYEILRKQESKDGTIKYLFDVLDGNAIETVLMSYHHGNVVIANLYLHRHFLFAKLALRRSASAACQKVFLTS